MSEDKVTSLKMPTYLERLPECLQKRTTCKFNDLGKCTILRDTHFSKDCPFFKERR